MARQLAVRRHDEILKRLKGTGSVSVAEMASHFDVSRETIRRDLKLLAERGVLDVVHGGAATRQLVETAIETREQENMAGKLRIGQAAAALVPNGATVLLDAGTTTHAVAVALLGHQGLTIATNALPIAFLLARQSSHRLLMLGGEVDRNDTACLGGQTMEALAQVRFDFAFIGAGGIVEDGAVTDYTSEAARFRRRLIKAAQNSYFVTDQSKFRVDTPYRIADIEAPTGVITDAPLDPVFAELFEKRNAGLIVADR